MKTVYRPFIVVRNENGEDETINSGRDYPSADEAQAWIHGVEDSVDFAQPDFQAAVLNPQEIEE